MGTISTESSIYINPTTITLPQAEFAQKLTKNNGINARSMIWCILSELKLKVLELTRNNKAYTINIVWTDLLTLIRPDVLEGSPYSEQMTAWNLR